MGSRWKRPICWLFGHDRGYVVAVVDGDPSSRTEWEPCHRCGDGEIPASDKGAWLGPDDPGFFGADEDGMVPNPFYEPSDGA